MFPSDEEPDPGKMSARVLGDKFTSNYYKYFLCFSFGTLEKAWKIANVTPVSQVRQI